MWTGDAPVTAWVLAFFFFFFLNLEKVENKDLYLNVESHGLRELVICPKMKLRAVLRWDAGQADHSKSYRTHWGGQGPWGPAPGPSPGTQCHVPGRRPHGLQTASTRSLAAMQHTGASWKHHLVRLCRHMLIATEHLLGVPDYISVVFTIPACNRANT